jgi:hypothetical protein
MSAVAAFGDKCPKADVHLSTIKGSRAPEVRRKPPSDRDLKTDAGTIKDARLLDDPESVHLPLVLGMKRDDYFNRCRPFSVCTDGARRAEYTVAHEH